MITEHDLKAIKPKPLSSMATSDHVHAGLPLPKPARIRSFSPSDWEDFIEEWATTLDNIYKKVRRFGGPGDLGIDIAGFVSGDGFKGVWDNYQCKHLGHSLRPADIWVEIGKSVYYSHCGSFAPPRRYYFICSQGVGTALEKLLNSPKSLKVKAQENWDEYCKTNISKKNEVPLVGALLNYFEAFDFTIFSSKSHLDLIQAHSKTGYHSVRFGGGLPARPIPGAPPALPTPEESRYIRQLLDAYADHLGAPITNSAELKFKGSLSKDFLRQRERFYHAEALKNFARDTVPAKTFDALQDEVFHGVVDVCERAHGNGLDRMRATLTQSTQVPIKTNPLASVTKTQDLQGICHQLANENRLTWVSTDE